MPDETPVTNGEIVTLSNQGLADTTDDIVANAERRFAQFEKILTLTLKRTNIHDWIDQDGKPYLVGSGAEKVARLFGVSWKILKSEKILSTDEKGQFYFYQVSGIFYLAGGRDTVEAVGTCSSKDKFFSKAGGEIKPMSEIDECNIAKSAYTNCVVNGITRLLGIRNLTWPQIHAGGIDQTKVASVKYAKGGAGGGKISKAQAGRFYAKAKATGKTDQMIKDYLKKEFNYTSTNEIDTSVYESLCIWADKKEEQKTA